MAKSPLKNSSRNILTLHGVDGCASVYIYLLKIIQLFIGSECSFMVGEAKMRQDWQFCKSGGR